MSKVIYAHSFSYLRQFIKIRPFTFATENDIFMTTEEATYFKDYIERRLSELLAVKSDDEKQELRIKDFAERYMQRITGQEYLPQSVFRLFLEELGVASFSVDFPIISEEEIESWFEGTGEGGEQPPTEEPEIEFKQENIVLSQGIYDEGTKTITWFAGNGDIMMRQDKGIGASSVNSSYISLPRVYSKHILSFIGAAERSVKIQSIEIVYVGEYFGNSLALNNTRSQYTVKNDDTIIHQELDTRLNGSHLFTTTNGDGDPKIYLQNTCETKNVQLRISEIHISYSRLTK